MSISLSVSLCLSLPTLSIASDIILFILDASGSMLDEVDGTRKMVTAKETLDQLLQDIPPETKLGLLSYGLFSRISCDDVHVVVGIADNTHEKIKNFIGKIKPKGNTPIANALKMGGEHLTAYKGENKYMILISDGIETCGGDPCQVARTLAEKGNNIKIHVVGFDVRGEAREQLECIAKAGRGRYFNADSTAGFKEAIAAVKEEVKAVEPEPEPAKPVEYFSDDFNGDDLTEHWEIINPDPDSFIVENGELLMINSTPASFAADNIGNMFHLNKPLPEGDWIATVKLNIDFQSGHERIFFGLYNDKENYLVSVLSTNYDANSGWHFLYITPTKALKGVVTSNQTNVWHTKRNMDFNSGMAECQPILLRLEKKGRAYISSMKLEGVAEPKWLEMPGLKLLRAKGNIAVGVFQAAKGKGETTVKVDWVKIEAPAKVE